ncbi:MAG: hypothetical protein COA82_09835, partial [Alkaliphilus sp.]
HMDSIIGAFNLTKDREQRIISYEHRVRMLRVDQAKKEEEARISAQMMNDFERQQSILLSGMTLEGMQIEEESSFYDVLAARSTDADVSASQIRQTIIFLEDQIRRLVEDAVPDQQKTQARLEVTRLMGSIKEQLGNWVGITILTAQDYFEEKLGGSVIMLAPVETYADSKLKLNMAIAFVLALMVGVFITFFREYWRSSAKQKQAQSNV